MEPINNEKTERFELPTFTKIIHSPGVGAGNGTFDISKIVL